MNANKEYLENPEPPQSTDEYDNKLISYLRANQMAAEHLRLHTLCHSVEDAAQAVQADKADFVKNVCMIEVKVNYL